MPNRDTSTVPPKPRAAYHSYRPPQAHSLEPRAEHSPINPRLVNLLGSFIGCTSAYALARLEFCLAFPETVPPPVLTRLPDASERTLRERWDGVEDQLHAIVDYLKQIENEPSSSWRAADEFRLLGRTVRELDQYARALRWVMTVTQHDHE